MTDKLEMVARAIAVAVDEEPDGPNHTWDGSLLLGINGPAEYKNWEGHKIAAKAAIEAHEKALEAEGLVIVPGEPTEALLELMSEVFRIAWWNADNNSRCDAWQAMLAVLEGK